MKSEFLVSLVALFFAGPLAAADTAHALRQSKPDVVFHFGIVPAELVLAHPEQHPERAMHRGGASKGTSHVVVAVFDTIKGERIADAVVTATVTRVGDASTTRALEPMAIANQPSFGGFFSFGAPGIYRLRFEARRPSVLEVSSAEFEYRVSAEGR